MKTLQKVVISLTVLAVVVFAIHGVEPATGADAASFYKGKKIIFIVPYKPGGGYDTYARMIAPFLEKEMGATVVVRNMPGGETYVAFNHVYRGKPNGLTIIIQDGKVATLNQLAKDPKAKGIDIVKFNWLCRITEDKSAITMGVKSGYRTVEDMKKATKPIKFGATSKGSRGHIAASVLLEILGAKGEIIMGFGGSPQLALATMRGELDGFGGSAASSLDFTQQPELFTFCVVAGQRAAVIPDVPTLGELVALRPEQEKWVDRLDKIMGADRVILTTPGVPTERVELLRNALHKVLHDKEFLAIAKKSERPIDYLSGPEVQSFAADLLKMPESEAKQVIGVMLDKYLK